MTRDDNPTRRFIGIDGGGTKTTCIIGDENGQIFASTHGTSSNIRSKPLNEVKQVLAGVIDDILYRTNTNMNQVKAIYLALAGSDLPEAKDRIHAALQPLIGKHTQLFIENDAMAALAAGTWGAPGIVLIAGTGSIAYAQLPSGHIVRVGGWGYLLGDEGSGFDIGRRGLASVLKQFDGRGENTLLTPLLIDQFQLSTPAELISLIYNDEDIKGKIASVSKVVFSAAKEEDCVALRIIDDAISDLLSLVQAAKKTLEANGLPLVISGGLFTDTFFKNRFIQKGKGLQVIDPSVPPAAGAFILSLKSSRIEITDQLKSVTENSLTVQELG